MKNNEAVSIAKGLGIILMVIGHAGCSGWMFYFIYLFHMPLFFWLSGYCFKEKYMDDKKTFVWHRIKGLYVPFIKYNLLFIVVHNLLFELKIFKTTYDWQETLTKAFHTLFMGYTEINLGPYWFLRYLLLSALAFLLLKTLFRHRPNVIRYGFWLIPLLAIPCNYFHITHILSTVMLLSFFFYCAGYASKNIKITRNPAVILMAFAVVAVASAFIHSLMLIMKTADIVPYCLTALAGIYATFALSSLLAQSKTWLKRALVYIGNHTMVILTWHFIVFDFISIFYLNVILHRSFNSIEEEGLHHQLGGLHFLVYTVLGITIPLLLQWLLNPKNIKRWLHIG